MDLHFWTSSWTLRCSLFRARVSPSWVLNWPPCCMIKTSFPPCALPPPRSIFNTESKQWGLAPCTTPVVLASTVWLFLESCRLSTPDRAPMTDLKSYANQVHLGGPISLLGLLTEVWVTLKHWATKMSHPSIIESLLKAAKNKSLLQLTFFPLYL